jgi:hypothetical protein
MEKQKKKTKYKSTKTQKLTKKQQLADHQYFIIQCKYNNYSNLNHKYLEEHLKKLNILPDKNSHKYETDVKKQVAKQYIKYKDFCEFKKNVKLLDINYKINADVFFYHINSMRLNKPFYNYPKFLLNMLNFNYMKTLNKNVIYSNIYKIDPKLAENYFIETFTINQTEKYHFPRHYILRPTDSFSGDNILYIKDKIQLKDAIDYYNNTKNYRGLIYGNNVIASEFITNLILFNEKKFHLRMYYLVSFINGVFNSFLLSFGKILTAKDKYDLSKPFTKHIHDTHFKSTDNDYFFPNDFTTDTIGKKVDSLVINTIYNKCKKICSGITKIIKTEQKNTSLLYPKQKNGYYIFGLDLLIRDNLELVLIECNDQSGMDCKNKKNIDYLSEIIYNWINDIVLEPLFKYNDPYKARTHPTYITLEG